MTLQQVCRNSSTGSVACMSALCSSHRTCVLQNLCRSSRWVSGPSHRVQTAEKCKADGAGKVETHSADLTSVQSRDKLVTGLLADHSSIDILVNAAGVLGIHTTSIGESAANIFGGALC
jgi:NAD(P)-dependent dehydrogenase (short-subunit alcohol dehydrogenase family)